MKEISSEQNKYGSKIIDLSKLKDHLHEITQNAATCSASTENALVADQAIVFAGEHNSERLVSVLLSRCAGCNAVIALQHLPGSKEITGGEYWECNLAAVQMTTGGGHAPLTESMAVISMPVVALKVMSGVDPGSWGS